MKDQTEFQIGDLIEGRSTGVAILVTGEGRQPGWYCLTVIEDGYRFEAKKSEMLFLYALLSGKDADN